MDQSTKIPIIKLYDNLIVSIQVDLSDRVVLQLKEDITNAIMSSDATGLVLELSGIELMDSFITRSISDIGKTARLMGVETAIAGLSPMIAVTLVEMGMDFEGVHPALNLEAALEHLEQAKRERGLVEEDGETDRLARQMAQAGPRDE
ncbi:MAG: STAS domain-containing protein [Deltaproteobacteria bacterium]|jgi:rsbT antagonist protein RsbS|nr:STAS domain-containing protein [Deltaproteobacteria bacterium]